MRQRRVGDAAVFAVPPQRDGEAVGVLRAELVDDRLGFAVEVVEPRRAAGVVVRQRGLCNRSAAGPHTVAGAVHARTLPGTHTRDADTRRLRCGYHHVACEA